jgi:hypothetical protein
VAGDTLPVSRLRPRGGASGGGPGHVSDVHTGQYQTEGTLADDIERHARWPRAAGAEGSFQVMNQL